MPTSNPELTAAEQWIGGTFVVASVVLTVHSLFRMCIMRTSASKLFLFPIVNTLLLACELDSGLFIGLSTHGSNLHIKWMQAGKGLTLGLVTTIILYLAYMRCRAVFLLYRRYSWAHYTLIVTSAVILMAASAADVADIIGCGGNADDPRCSTTQVIGRVKEWSVPVMRFYYIISEGIFFVMLFRTLWNRDDGENPNTLDRLSRLTTFMFILDLVLLTAVSIYRIIRLFKPLPDHELVELFSIAVTVFNMTEFGLNIPKLFRSVGRRTSSGAAIRQHRHLHLSVTMTSSTPCNNNNNDNNHDIDNNNDNGNDNGSNSIRRASTMPTHSKSYSSSHAPLASCLGILHASSSSHRHSRSSDYERNRLTQFNVVHTQALLNCHDHDNVGAVNPCNAINTQDISTESHHNRPAPNGQS